MQEKYLPEEKQAKKEAWFINCFVAFGIVMLPSKRARDLASRDRRSLAMSAHRFADALVAMLGCGRRFAAPVATVFRHNAFSTNGENKVAVPPLNLLMAATIARDIA